MPSTPPAGRGDHCFPRHERVAHCLHAETPAAEPSVLAAPTGAAARRQAAQIPEHLLQLLGQRILAGDVDRIVALQEQNAMIINSDLTVIPGEPVPGLAAIDAYPLPTRTELPANTAQWTLDPRRAVLLVHDMQRYFLAPFPEEIRDPLVRNCALLGDRCAALGVPVSYTAQPGGMTEEQRGLLKDFWGPGMRVDLVDRQIVDELEPRPGDIVFTKWRYSAFFRTDLLAHMRDQGRDQLIVCGVYAHVGVLMTALEAFTHDIQSFLVADAVGDFSAEHHRMALDYAAGRCAMVTTTEEVFR